MSGTRDVSWNSARAIARSRTRLLEWLKASLIERLSLPLNVDEIADDTPIFGTGLGLDSVDALEIALAIETEFGVAVDDEDIAGFRSINLVADFIQGRIDSAELDGRELENPRNAMARRHDVA